MRDTRLEGLSVYYVLLLKNYINDMYTWDPFKYLKIGVTHLGLA